jgi:hypothetical protein
LSLPPVQAQPATLSAASKIAARRVYVTNLQRIRMKSAAVDMALGFLDIMALTRQPATD